MLLVEAFHVYADSCRNPNLVETGAEDMSMGVR